VPFKLHRQQFPVWLGFAITINKSQGQSLKFVGLDLHSPVFSHGQFYVGVSRGTNWGRVKIQLQDTDMIANVVFKDVIIDP
jgi:hypothetical protein